MHFSCEEREKKEKTQTNDHWRQFNNYLPHHMKEDTIVHLVRRRMTRFDH